MRNKRRTQADRSATTRRALLDAATICLANLGYAATTVEFIAAKARVSRGAVQHHFGSRDDLLSAIVDDLGSQLMEHYEISGEMTVVQRIDAAIDKDWTTLNSAQFRAAMQVWLSMRSNAQLFSQVSNEVAKIERHLDDYWSLLFADSGIPKKKIAVLRHVVFSTLRGLAIRSIYRSDAVPWREEIKALKEMTIQALLSK